MIEWIVREASAREREILRREEEATFSDVAALRSRSSTARRTCRMSQLRA